MSLSEKLITAAKKGNAREARKLLGRGALFIKDEFGNTALHEAARNGNKDIVKALLGSFCFVDSINHAGFTPLHLASQNGHAKVAKTLLKWKADPGLLNQHGETALHLVAKYNHASVVSAFGVFKIPVDLRGKEGNTALHIAAKLGNVEVMKSLLHHGADPSATSMRGLKPLDYAECGNYKECIKILQSALLKKKSKGLTSNDYSTTVTHPPVKRADTYSCDFKATKNSTGNKKSTTSFKQQLSSRRRKGYFSEDESSYQEEDSARPSFSASQEAPDNFTQGTERVGDYRRHASQGASPTQSKSASIDQLLSEMEREYYGPSYSYSPPEDPYGLITPYAEIRQLEPPRHAPVHSSPVLIPSSNDRDNYDYLPPSKEKNYDIPRPSNPTPNSSHSFQRNNNSSRSYTHVSASSLRHNSRTKHSLAAKSSRSPGKSSPKSPSKSTHKSSLHSFSKDVENDESLKLKDQDDMDTYVYMAPLTDFSDTEIRGVPGRLGGGVDSETWSEVSIPLQDAASEASSTNSSDCGSKNSKRTVICNSPLHPDKKHEPFTASEPVKGILSQSSVTENDKSHLELYLQDELETMRQAFQIRLGQLEKRYQRQLVMEQRKNLKPQSVHRKIKPISPYQTNSSKRRNSWHSYIPSEQELDKLAQPDEPRSESSLGIDSDHSMDGSDAEGWDEMDSDEEMKGKVVLCDNRGSFLNDLPESLRHESEHPIPPKHSSTPTGKNGGLKGGSRLWTEGSAGDIDNPQLSLVNTEVNKEETVIIDEEAKLIIQKKMEEYREKMMRYFQEKSEAQISIIEQKYQKQMNEVKRQFKEKSSEKMSHLTTRIKDLETMLDVQTLV